MSKFWVVLLISIALSSFSQMLLKKGASVQYQNAIQEYLNPWVICGYGMMVLSTIGIIFAYRGLDYKHGAIAESISYLLITMLSRVFFDEKITKRKAIGNILILAGVFLFYI